MPTLLDLRFTGPTCEPYQHANGLRALLFGWLERIPLDVAAPIIRRLRDKQLDYQAEGESHRLGHEFHDLQRLNPVTMGPLIPQPDGGHHLRLGVLTDDLLPALMEVISEDSSIRLGVEEYFLESIESSAARSYEDMLAPAPNQPIAVAFESPMAFHYQPLGGMQSPWSHRMWRTLLGESADEALDPKPDRSLRLPRKALPWPDPDRCFFHWRSKWAIYGDYPLMDELPLWVNRHVAVSSCRGETYRVNLAEEGRFARVFIGFAGEAEFSILDAKNIVWDVKRQIWALARFATYCGTGVDTIRGMGQTLGPE